MDATYLPSAVIFFSGPATVLITGAVTSASAYILVVGVGFWQAVFHNQSMISHESHILSLKKSTLLPISRPSPLILHPVTKFISLNNFQVLPNVARIMGKSSRLMCTALSVLVHAALKPHLQPLLCTCPRFQPNQPTVLSSKPYTYRQCSPSRFPPVEIPTPSQDSAKMLDLTRTFFMSSLLTTHPK